MDITSVSEFVSYVETLEPTYPSQQFVGCFTFFRGQANKDWNLTPSLYRQGLFEEEQLLIRYIRHSCPDELPVNRFETLVKLQHFGLPTRLLDTTTNPLVALFFACNSEKCRDLDGVVYTFPNLPVMWSNDSLIELIMDCVFEYGHFKIDLSTVLKKVYSENNRVWMRRKPESVNDLLHDLTIPAFAVMPEKTNPRIIAQDGAFFLCGMKVLSTEISQNPGTKGTKYYQFGPADLTNGRSIWHKAEHVIIPASAKENIIKQLDVMGINEAKLFPDLSHQAKHAVEYVIQNRKLVQQFAKESSSS